MDNIAKVLVGLVAAIHIYVVILEMVLWRSRGPKVFGITRQFANDSAGLASNQGLYNGFLVAALALGLFLPDPRLAHAFTLYGLICVALAGVWGAITANPRILF